MVEVRHVSVKPGDALLLVGTTKGAFLLRSGPARSRWDTGGPYFPGDNLYALGYDGRAGRHRIWAGNTSGHWGPQLSSSDDFGRTWVTPETAAIRFPDDTGASLTRVWQIRTGADDDTLYCGVEPSALFESRDAGAHWSLVRGLWDHPDRERWARGGGGRRVESDAAVPW